MPWMEGNYWWVAHWFLYVLLQILAGECGVYKRTVREPRWIGFHGRPGPPMTGTADKVLVIDFDLMALHLILM